MGLIISGMESLSLRSFQLMLMARSSQFAALGKHVRSSGRVQESSSKTGVIDIAVPAPKFAWDFVLKVDLSKALHQMLWAAPQKVGVVLQKKHPTLT